MNPQCGGSWPIPGTEGGSDLRLRLRGDLALDRARGTRVAHRDLAGLGGLGDRDPQREHAVGVLSPHSIEREAVAERQLTGERARRPLPYQPLRTLGGLGVAGRADRERALLGVDVDAARVDAREVDGDDELVAGTDRSSAS